MFTLLLLLLILPFAWIMKIVWLISFFDWLENDLWSSDLIYIVFSIKRSNTIYLQTIILSWPLNDNYNSSFSKISIWKLSCIKRIENIKYNFFIKNSLISLIRSHFDNTNRIMVVKFQKFHFLGWIYNLYYNAMTNILSKTFWLKAIENSNYFIMVKAKNDLCTKNV